MRLFRLPAEPVALTALAGSTDPNAALARRVVARLDWPGKPASAVKVAPLTEDERKRFAAGAELYASFCVACHQADGRGREKLAPSLVESRYSTGTDAGAATRVLLSGKEGATGLMPPLGGTLNDEQIASVLTYIRRDWGNTGSPVTAADVQEIRGLTRTRTRPWTEEELLRVR
jgi:mono/diheme cytochrome c family protein